MILQNLYGQRESLLSTTTTITSTTTTASTTSVLISSRIWNPQLFHEIPIQKSDGPDPSLGFGDGFDFGDWVGGVTSKLPYNYTDVVPQFIVPINEEGKHAWLYDNSLLKDSPTLKRIHASCAIHYKRQ